MLKATLTKATTSQAYAVSSACGGDEATDFVMDGSDEVVAHGGDGTGNDEVVTTTGNDELEIEL